MTYKKKIKIWWILLLLGSSLPFYFATQVQAQIVDRLLVIVGNQIVTSRDLQQSIRLNLDARKLSALPPEQQEKIKKKQLERLVDNLLLALKAAQLNISVTDEEINQTIERVKKENGFNNGELKAILAQQGMTYEAYRHKLMMEIQRTKLINREIKPHIIITEDEIIAYAKKHKLLKKSHEEVTLAQILLPTAKTPAEKEELEKTVTTIKRRFAAGEPFAKLVKEYSIDEETGNKDGLLGTFAKGDLIPEIEKVVFDQHQPLNKLTDVITTCLGNHLFLIMDRQTPSEAGKSVIDPEVKKQIEKAIFNLKVKQQLRQILAEMRQEVPVVFRN